MKTTQEKAKELFRKVYLLDHKIWQDTAKQIALIMVDEIIKSHTYRLSIELKNYWNEVKEEINKL